MKTLKQKKKPMSITAKGSAKKAPSDYLKNVSENQIKLCSVCKPLEGEKYRSRPSPSCHAADCPNQMAEGNDKRLYISVPDSRGVYKWQPMTTWDETRRPPITTGKQQTYYIHDNGSRPFKVVIRKTQAGREIDIYIARYPEFKLNKKYDYPKYYQLHRTYQIPHGARIFIGDDPENIYKSRPDQLKEWLGNSILAELSAGRYLFIGELVFEFQTANENSGITLFRSPVGNNDVPYPFAADDEYIYLLIEDVRVAKTHIDLNQKPFDPYRQHYGDVPNEKLGKTVVIPRQ